MCSVVSCSTLITPCAHARSGVKQSVSSVRRLSVCQPCKIEISQCTVAKPDKKMGIRKKRSVCVPDSYEAA